MSIDFLASNVSTHDFSTLHTILQHNLIKVNFTKLIKQAFNRESSFNLACNENRFFLFFE